jgi:hypothetical protein
MDVGLLEKLMRHMTLKTVELEQENQKLKTKLALQTVCDHLPTDSVSLTQHAVSQVSSQYERHLIELLRQNTNQDELLCFHATLESHEVAKVKSIVAQVSLSGNEY